MTCVYQDLKQAELNYCNVYIVFGAELLEDMLKKGTFQENYFEEGQLSLQANNVANFGVFLLVPFWYQVLGISYHVFFMNS